MWYDIYHFGIKSMPEFQAIVLSLDESIFDPNMQVFRTKSFDRLAYLVKIFADIIDCPKKIIAVFFWKVDGHFSGSSRRPITFYFADNVVKIVNVPPISPEFGQDVAKRNEFLARWNHQITTAAAKDQSFDEAHATVFNTLEGESRKGILRKLMNDPWKVDFYKSLSITLNSWVYGRYMVRGTIKLASGFMFLVTGVVIRNTPSKEVMNSIIDHSGPMPAQLWVFGLLYVVSDVIKEVIIRYLMRSDSITLTYAQRRFARLFVSNSYLLMILSCHVCCNSDVFLTFANMDFGK
jgi:hypothetical protein